MRTLLMFAVLFAMSCTHSPTAREPAAATDSCDEAPCTSNPHAHWTTGLRNDNVTNFGLAGTKIIALTFDDGPGDGTRRILELLDQYDIEATYFNIGENVKDHPRLFKLITSKKNADGSQRHTMGNHSYTHPDLQLGKYTSDNEALYRQLVMTDLIIKRSMGEDGFFSQSNGVIYFRAPYGSWKPADARQMRKKMSEYSSEAVNDLKHYYGPVYWDIGGGIKCANRNEQAAPKSDPCEGQALEDAADWECWDRGVSPERCADGYFARAVATGGGVVLSHEIYKKTAQMYEILLPRLKAAGFKFVRFDKIPNVNRVKLPKALSNDN